MSSIDNGPIPSEQLQRLVSRYEPASQISPIEFEKYVSEVLRALDPAADDLQIDIHPTVTGVDGDYDLDAMATFTKLGMTFRVVVEAKRHKNPIKRELVQVLHSKMISVGAQKAILIAAGKYQSGAIEYALVHGIALATLSEGRLTMETKSTASPPQLTADQATELGWEKFAAMTTVKSAGKVRGFRLSPRHIESFVEWVVRSSQVASETEVSQRGSLTAERDP